jgi:hypothetical protein
VQRERGGEAWRGLARGRQGRGWARGQAAARSATWPWESMRGRGGGCWWQDAERASGGEVLELASWARAEAGACWMEASWGRRGAERGEELQVDASK